MLRGLDVVFVEVDVKGRCTRVADLKHAEPRMGAVRHGIFRTVVRSESEDRFRDGEYGGIAGSHQDDDLLLGKI